jgi:hypothetical protein
MQFRHHHRHQSSSNTQYGLVRTQLAGNAAVRLLVCVLAYELSASAAATAVTGAIAALINHSYDKHTSRPGVYSETHS